MDRREILKMFGIAAAAIPAAKVAVAEVSVPALQMMQQLQPPRGMVYQWKRIFITADEPDLNNILKMVAAGWKPVPLMRHPEVLANSSSYWIEGGGLVLMEKPADQIPPPQKYPVPFEADEPFEADDTEWVENDTLWKE
jgi:hypothetical protein